MLRIVIVSVFYAEGMGYSENCLPKALAALGHDVHVISSNTLNPYYSEEEYTKNYASFLGPANQETGTFTINGYTVHRLKYKKVYGYIYIKGLKNKLKQLKPDIVQCTEIASLNTFALVLLKKSLKFHLFTETHQHLSVMKSFMRQSSGSVLKKIAYKLTRTLPSYLASKAIEKCYAIAPDCVEVANIYYGVPKHKIKLQPLGTDTILFHPAVSQDEIYNRQQIRSELGYTESDIVCIYTGRFSKDKNPLLFAKAISNLANRNLSFHGLFIGSGVQQAEIEQLNNTQILPFIKYDKLANYYRAADIGVWPTQESISMLDAAACGIPLVVSDKIGEVNRVIGNGYLYNEGDSNDLSLTLEKLIDKNKRIRFGIAGSQKMADNYSWEKIAKNIEADYLKKTIK